jgi:thiol-disulfide isomerase/thioredoxin
MIPLPTQEEFEALYTSDLKSPHVIYFTASWCGPCRGIDKPLIESSCKDVRMYICDVDVNGYTPGFCGVRSIPSFLVLKPKAEGDTKNKNKNTIVGPYQNSKTADVITWIQANTS